MDLQQIVRELLSLYREQLTFWERGGLNQEAADLRYYDVTSKRIEKFKARARKNDLR